MIKLNKLNKKWIISYKKKIKIYRKVKNRFKKRRINLK